MLSILALVLVVAALLGEVMPDGEAKYKAVKWLKAHALNVAVALDIVVAEHGEAVTAIKELRFDALPNWVYGAVGLIILSFILKSSKNRKVARLAAAALVVAETVE